MRLGIQLRKNPFAVNRAFAPDTQLSAVDGQQVPTDVPSKGSVAIEETKGGVPQQ